MSGVAINLTMGKIWSQLQIICRVESLDVAFSSVVFSTKDNERSWIWGNIFTMEFRNMLGHVKQNNNNVSSTEWRNWYCTLLHSNVSTSSTQFCKAAGQQAQCYCLAIAMSLPRLVSSFTETKPVLWLYLATSTLIAGDAAEKCMDPTSPALHYVVCTVWVEHGEAV